MDNLLRVSLGGIVDEIMRHFVCGCVCQSQCHNFNVWLAISTLRVVNKSFFNLKNAKLMRFVLAS